MLHTDERKSMSISLHDWLHQYLMHATELGHTGPRRTCQPADCCCNGPQQDAKVTLMPETLVASDLCPSVQ